MYRKSMHQKFYEEDITDFGEERLKRIALFLVLTPSGWTEYIDNLEMVLIDGRIIVRGWATSRRWRKFTQTVLEDASYSSIYDSSIKRVLKSRGY